MRFSLCDFMDRVFGPWFKDDLLSISSVGHVDLIAIDSLGRRAGYYEEQKYSEIPGATVTDANDKKSLQLPLTETYQFQISSSSSNPLMIEGTIQTAEPIDLSFFIFDPVSDTEARTIQFNNVNLPQDETASLQFMSGQADTQMEISNGINVLPDVNEAIRRIRKVIFPRQLLR